ncbi:hypothetical protein C8K61_11035 [Pseudomonas sp. GV071]|nr:hypothetical protein C8K61_11035 [Pseudomonas sp. GV071]
MERGEFSRSENPRWGQAFLLTFSATGKSESRVRRETKTPSARGNEESHRPKSGTGPQPENYNFPAFIFANNGAHSFT